MAVQIQPCDAVRLKSQPHLIYSVRTGAYIMLRGNRIIPARSQGGSEAVRAALSTRREWQGNRRARRYYSHIIITMLEKACQYYVLLDLWLCLFAALNRLLRWGTVHVLCKLQAFEKHPCQRPPTIGGVATDTRSSSE